MRTARTVRTTIVVLWAVVLCLMIAFAAEPTTSTQFDVQEGRGVAVVHSGDSQLSRTVVSAADAAPRALVPVAVLAAVLVALAGAQRRNPSAAAGRVMALRSLLDGDERSRRGPPLARG